MTYLDKVGRRPEYKMFNRKMFQNDNDMNPEILNHDFENHWTYQQYLPDKIKNKKYYEYGPNKNEQAFKAYWDKVKGNKS